MANFTEKAMAESLKKLLEKKTLDKITIKDITEDCGVNRQTFYYHFHDVYELLDWIFTEETEKFIAEHVEGKDWKDSILLMMERLLDDKPLIINSFRSVKRRQLEQYLQDRIKPVILKQAKTFAEGMTIDEEDLEFVVSIFTFAFIGILIEWVAAGMHQDYKKNIERFFLIIDGTMEGTLEKFSK